MQGHQHVARLPDRDAHRRRPQLVVLRRRRRERRTGVEAVKITAEPRSDQWNADDFLGGPRTFTIAGVREGTADQKYDIELVEGRSEEHTSELQSRENLVCRLLLEKKKRRI